MGLRVADSDDRREASLEDRFGPRASVASSGRDLGQERIRLIAPRDRSIPADLDEPMVWISRFEVLVRPSGNAPDNLARFDRFCY